MSQSQEEQLQRLIQQIYPLPKQLSELITGQCRIYEVPRKQIISDSGKPDSSEYFLLQGIMHRYVLTEQGDFITTDFYVGPAIIMPHFVRTSNGRSLFSLQALTALWLAEIPVQKMDTFSDAHPAIRTWRQKVVEQKLKRNFVEEIHFRRNTAKERLAHLRREYPNLENKIPHTCIASYVGVTPVSFSRLRKELAQS